MPHGNSIHQLPDDYCMVCDQPRGLSHICMPPRIRRSRRPILMYEEKRVLGIIIGLVVFACIVNWIAP